MVIISLIICIVVVIPTAIVMMPMEKTTNIGSEVPTVKEKNEKKEKLALPEVEVQINRAETGEIETVPLEKYVISVVASEMPAEFETEALKAQAIAARTYFINHMIHQKEGEDFVVTDTTEHQVYKSEEELKTVWGSDYHWKMEKVTEAVMATEGEIITYEDEPITPTFFSMSNGYTEDAKNYWGNELPYLKSVESKWEESLPNFTEQKVFTTTEVANALGVNLQTGYQIPMEMTRTESNRVSELTIDGNAFTGREVREKLGLRSNDFSIKQKDDHLIFTTKGYGHGVGMSQYGANGMATDGKDYKEILRHYYQGIDIHSIPDAVPTLVSR